jgi:hypothetical protein
MNNPSTFQPKYMTTRKIKLSVMTALLNRNSQHRDTRRYGTGSDSDRAPTERALSRAPGRYRSRYHVRQDNDK